MKVETVGGNREQSNSIPLAVPRLSALAPTVNGSASFEPDADKTIVAVQFD